MNEVREICAQMLDAPAPPMRGVDEVLAIARQSRRRRGWFTASGAGAAALAVLAAAAALVGPGIGVVEPPPVTLAVPPIGSAPSARAAPVHGQQMAATLVAAVPRSYEVRVDEGFGLDTTVHPPLVEPAPGASPDGRLRILAGAVVRVSDGDGVGQLFAYLVHDGQVVPEGDVCRAELARLPGATCRVDTVHGISIRTVVVDDAIRRQVVEATRFLAGGRLTVVSWQGLSGDLLGPWPANGFGGTMPFDDGVIWYGPPLASPVLTGTQVAALARDPAMLQFT